MKLSTFPRLLKQYLAIQSGVRIGKKRAVGMREAIGLEQLEPRVLMSGNPIITEFMADNNRTLDDGDGRSSDWIEIRNAGDAAVDLAGYSLTDDPLLVDKWEFPSVTLGPGEHLVVFASGQLTNDYVDGSGYLHTNFKLDADGDYLGFFQPDDTLINEFAVGGADYPNQKEDVSYGTAYTTVETTLIDRGASVQYLVPGSAGELPSDWADVGFDDSGWSTGNFGLGYDSLPPDPNAGLSNIAPSGTASQSTTLGALYTAANGIDGNTGNLTHTLGTDMTPSWSVAFDQNYPIDHLVIHNRDSCCQARMRDITVEIFDIDGTTKVYDSGLLNAENVLGSPETIELDFIALLGDRVDGALIRILRTPDPDWSGAGATVNDANDASVLSLGEVEVWAEAPPLPVNIASEGFATQTSTLNASYPASNAVDGNYGNFTHTQGATVNPVWTLTYAENHQLSSIVLHNRDSCCGSRLRDITVEILDAVTLQPVYTSALLNPENTGGTFPLGPDNIVVDLVALTGDLVMGGVINVMRTSDPDLSGTSGQGNADEANVLALGEVEVFAVVDENAPTNVAENKLSSQTSTGFALPANLANDGDVNTKSHTLNSDSNPTWEVDLAGSFAISEISLINRQDCCQSRMRDITVSILAADRSVIWTSELLNAENAGFAFPAGPGSIDIDLVALAGKTISGAYVQVHRTPDPDLSGTAGQGNTDEANVLSMGEVRVMGVPSAPFASFIGTDVESEMKNTNASIFTRTEFDVTDPDALANLTLSLQADDGYVVYLNGTEILNLNAPGVTGWDSNATSAVEGETGLTFIDHDITAFTSLLNVGTNVLAIQGLNVSAGDEDFLLHPELTGTTITDSAENVYMLTPTPGALNGEGVLGFVKDTNYSGPDRGFYEEAFDVVITSATPGAMIVYTTDGSTPSLTNGVQVQAVDELTGPEALINIAQTTVLRAGAFKEGFEPTNIDTQSYFFLDDVFLQNNDGSAPVNWPTAPVNSQVFDYGIDPEVTALYTNEELKSAFTSISTISLVTDLGNLVDPAIGIYVNAQNRGKDWERPVSVEIIHPDGFEAEHEEFQIDAGLRIRGGASRNPGFFKHSFRLFFRGEYGDTKLNVPIFGEEGTDSFDALDLRTSQNYDWARHADAAGLQNTFVREVFSRDTQGATGEPYTRSRYYHLYLNGTYWGVYQSQERAEAGYGEEYFGGDKDDYDVIKSSNHIGGFTTEATDGNLDAWNDFWTQSRAIAAEADNAVQFEKYMQIQGLNPDGTRNEAFPVHLDADNLINYMLTIFYSGDGDAPLSSFLGNNRANNWFTMRNRETGEMGWQFFRHDAEHTHGTNNSQLDRTGPFGGSNQNNFLYSNPQWIYQDLLAVEEFRVRVADLVRKHFFNAGVMTDAVAIENFMKRADQVSEAMIGQSARWGDAKRTVPYTILDWQNEIDSVIASDLPGRTAIVVQQLIDDGLYPNFGTPTFNVNGSYQHGGEVGLGDALSITLDQNTFINSTLLSTGALGDAFIPTDGTLDKIDGSVPDWAGVVFDTTSWPIQGQPTGFGYETGTGNEADIATSVLTEMQGVSTSLYARIPFTLTAGDLVMDALTLKMKYDDGFIAYLNGVEVARSSSVTDTTPGYDTVATSHEAASFEDFDITAFKDLLVVGDNVLAIHGVNINSTSTDFVMRPELVASVLDESEADAVYYTTDGSDPRLLGGEINPDAILYDGSFPINASAVVSARTYTDGGEWSAMNRALFTVDMPIRVSEIQYNPDGSDDAEFIELVNIGTQTVDLTGMRFVDEAITGQGISFEFLDTDVNRFIEPGGRLVIVRNLEVFGLVHPNVPASLIADRPFDGALENAGETLTLVDAAGGIVQEFDYSDDWDKRTDGDGPSLDLIDPTAAKETWNDAASWRVSGLTGGTPGRVDPVDGAIPGDFNYDGIVNIADLAKLASNFNKDSTVDPLLDIRWEHGDSNGDGKVNIADLSQLASRFNQTGSDGFPVAAAGAGAAAMQVEEALLLNVNDGDAGDDSELAWDHIGNLLDDDDAVTML